jgi:hypothetical protein
MVLKGYRIGRRVLQIFLCATIIPAALSGYSSDAGTDALSAYTKGDYKTALKLLKPMAEQGNTFAEFTIGKMYAYGEGTAKDPKKGAAYIQSAADKGLATAQYHMAQLCMQGLGVARDL